MDVTISIPDEVAEKLRRRAADVGQSIPVYASRVVADNVTRPSLEEILASVRADFAGTGMSEGELSDFLRGELDAHRHEKKAKTA